MKINKLLESNKVKEDLDWNKYKITYVTAGGREDSLVFNTWQSDVEYAWRMSPHNVPHTKVKSIELLESKNTLKESKDTFSVRFNTRNGAILKSMSKSFDNYKDALNYAKNEDEDLGWTIEKNGECVTTGGYGGRNKYHTPWRPNQKSIKEDTSYEWKPNTSFKHIKDIYEKVKANGYKYVNNEREEFMAAVKKAEAKGYKPEQCRQIRDWHKDIWAHNRKTESVNDVKKEYLSYCKDLGIDSSKKSSKNRFMKDYARHISNHNGIKDIEDKLSQAENELSRKTESYEGNYSDKFRNLIKKYEDEGTSPSGIINDIIRYCPEDVLKDLWFDRGYARDFDKDELTEGSRISSVEPKSINEEMSRDDMLKAITTATSHRQLRSVYDKDKLDEYVYYCGANSIEELDTAEIKEFYDKIRDYLRKYESDMPFNLLDMFDLVDDEVRESLQTDGDTVKRWQIEYFIDENDDSDTPLTAYVYIDNKQEAIDKVKAEYPNAQIVYCVSENVPAQYKKWDMNEDTAVSSGYEFDDDTDDLSYYYDDELFNDNLENSPYTEIASKSVPDFDGFMTDYTMYMNINTGEYVFILGDKDIYTPEDGNFDWECETEEEAREWFDSYNGYDDDIDESIMNESDAQESPIIHKKSDGSYLVAASNGDGYVAFNKSDVCMGNISANNETEAKNKFNANKFDE